MGRVPFDSIIARLPELKVAILGDAILDSYLEGHSSILASEAPVPIVHVEHTVHAPGGAGNTAVNVAALGAQAILFSAGGHDTDGDQLRERLEDYHVNTENLLSDFIRTTLVKRRILANDQTIMRIDSGSTSPLSPLSESRLIERLRQELAECDALIISDYMYGLVTPAILSALAELSRIHDCVITADSKDLTRLKDIRLTAAKPNYKETSRLLGLPKKTLIAERFEQVREHGEQLFEILNCRIAAVTLDKAGAVVFERDKPPYRTYSKQVNHDKAVGAGDTYIAALTLALAAGAATVEAAEFASVASQIATSKNGTAPCFLDELTNQESYAHKEIRTPGQLRAAISRVRAEEKQVVFTNGCFDILHRGHVTYLNQAKALGDILIVGVNTDDSIRRIKGADRPINRLEDRIHVLSGLSSVDFVIPFGENTPEALLREIRPDIFAKGGTYRQETLPEAAVVRELGGRIEILPYIDNVSTSEIINKIKQKGGAGV